MEQSQAWFEDDNLWETLDGIFFTSKRWGMAVEEMDDLIRTLDLKPGIEILDLCCGPGRHSIDLARRGFKVTGVDRTAHYLEKARDKAAWEGLHVEFVEEDMRRFQRVASFDLALSMFTSFGYFSEPDDDRTVADNVCRSLRPGGKFVIDLIGKEIVSRIFQKRDWEECDDTLVLEERTPSPDWSIMTSRWILIRNGTRKEFTVSLRMFSARELSDLLLSVGFSRVEVFGHLNGAPYDHRANRLIIIATK